MNLLIRAYRTAKYSRFAPLGKAAFLLSRYKNVSQENVEWLRGDRTLVVKGTRISVEPGNRQFLLEGITLANELVFCSGAELTEAADGAVILTVNKVRLLLQTWEELLIAHEVFVRGLYNLQTNRPYTLVDVGMNTGTTALFFASNPHCQAVHGFELFPKTAARARENLDLNQRLASKIQLTVAGLAAETRDAELDYYPEFKGSVGTNGLPDYARPKDRELKVERERVHLLGAGEAVEEIARNSKTETLVVKLDCEGAEYEILGALASTGVLARVHIFLIEWHTKGPHLLKRLLADAGFECVSFDDLNPNYGMIYAWRCPQ